MSRSVVIDLPATDKPTPGARLSCELCSQRKKRCDKLNPCSYCQLQGAVCKPVVRPRLPRGKRRVSKDASSTDSDSDLRARVARLEPLLQRRRQNFEGSLWNEIIGRVRELRSQAILSAYANELVDE